MSAKGIEGSSDLSGGHDENCACRVCERSRMSVQMRRLKRGLIRENTSLKRENEWLHAELAEAMVMGGLLRCGGCGRLFESERVGADQCYHCGEFYE